MRLSPSQLDEIQTVQLNAWGYTLPWYLSTKPETICGSLYLGGLHGLRTVCVGKPLISWEDRARELQQCHEFRALLETLRVYLIGKTIMVGDTVVS